MFDVFLNETIPNLLQETSLITFVAIYVAGILTSISPCVLSMVPVLVGFIGGYSQPSRLKAFSMSGAFVLGLATTFALLGIIAASLGTIFGQIGKGWYYFISVISIVMGFNLLGVINFRFPALKVVPPKVSGFLGAYMVGLLFGIVASPCATPILVAILALVSAKGEIGSGAALLFVYGLGHGMPLLIIGAFTGAVKKLSQVRQWTKNVNYVSGGILVILGLYFLYLVS